MNSSTSSSDLRAFSFRIALYGIVFLLGLVTACFFLPSKHARETMLGAQITKLKALEALPGERVIIVGGSGCGQGFVTSNICAALNRPVYNMGLHAGLGLIYQMAAVEPLIRKGDLVLLIPEYANFDGSSCFGDAELLMMTIDVIPAHKKLLTIGQWLHLLPLMPKYGADKLRVAFSKGFGTSSETEYYDSYGDSVYLDKPDAGRPFPAILPLGASAYSNAVIPYILAFAKTARDRGAMLCLFPPALQRSSYDNVSGFIEVINREMAKAGLPFAASPERYALDDAYFYDTPYHLNLNGRIFRTRLLIEDIGRETPRRNVPVGELNFQSMRAER